MNMGNIFEKAWLGFSRDARKSYIRRIDEKLDPEDCQVMKNWLLEKGWKIEVTNLPRSVLCRSVLKNERRNTEFSIPVMPEEEATRMAVFYAYSIDSDPED